MKRLMALTGALGLTGLLVAASASALSLGTTALTTRAASSAGAPTPTNVLLCGTWMSGSDRMSGASSIDHPSGSSAMGNEYAYSGQNCDNNNSSSIGMFSWTISHSNVNTSTERGTEHGLAMLSTDMNKNAGFNGQITNYDFTTPLTAAAPDSCGNREVYYASGQTDTSGSCSPAGPGNFNTHGGAATGDHFRGKYGTVVYQEQNNSKCNTGSSSYCFEAILEGQTN